jgi:hypothetical protein
LFGENAATFEKESGKCIYIYIAFLLSEVGLNFILFLYVQGVFNLRRERELVGLAFRQHLCTYVHNTKIENMKFKLQL